MGSLLSNPVVGRAKIQLHPEGEHSRTLIWLHGFRAYAEEFVDVFEDSKLWPVDANTKVILLNAGMKKISIAYGMKMNSWFNIYKKYV